jgi:hypothetical protein
MPGMPGQGGRIPVCRHVCISKLIVWLIEFFPTVDTSVSLHRYVFQTAGHDLSNLLRDCTFHWRFTDMFSKLSALICQQPLKPYVYAMYMYSAVQESCFVRCFENTQSRFVNMYIVLYTYVSSSHGVSAQGLSEC